MNTSNVTNDSLLVAPGNNYHETRSEAEKILFTTGLSLLIIVTIFGNTLVVMSFYMVRSLRTYTNYFIISLSLSDILVAVISMPLWITVEMLRFQGSKELTKAWTCFDIITGVASIWNLTAVSVDRYIHVTRPLTHSKLITRHRVLTVIIFIWIFSCAVSLVKGFHFYWEKPNYEMLVTCVGFLIPLVLIIFCYTRIYRVVKKHQHKSEKQSKCLHNQKRLKTDVKAIKTIAIVVLAVFICWGPFFIANVWYGWCLYQHNGRNVRECKLNKNVIAFVKWLHYANSAINPIIYACFNRDFRNGFKIALYKHLSTGEKGTFTSIINRTSFRDTLANSIHDGISSNITGRLRSRTLDIPADIHLNGGLVKRHSIATASNEIHQNGPFYQSQVTTKISTSSSERTQLLIPRISV